jgi:hypothetical protein
MTTLREAAQAVLDAYHLDGDGIHDALKAMKSLRAALAAPEPTQEPVAWATMLGSYALITWQQRKPDENQYSVPLYAHPAPPQTPMTEEEIKATWIASSNLIAFTRSVERHHGIGPARGE